MIVRADRRIAIVLLFLPDSPTRARWASEDDKVKFVERVRRNDQGIKQKIFRKDQMREALTDPYSWLLFFLMLFQTLVVGGVSLSVQGRPVVKADTM